MNYILSVLFIFMLNLDATLKDAVGRTIATTLQ